MIITILLAGLLLILAAGIRCGFALDDLIRMAVNGIKKAVNVLIVLAIYFDRDHFFDELSCFFYDRDFIWNSCNHGRD